MRNTNNGFSVLAVVLFSILPGCYASHSLTSEENACAALTVEFIPGAHVDYITDPAHVPMCPWHLDRGCDLALWDYNGDGVFTYEDADMYCFIEFAEADAYPDTAIPGDRTTWCITCE